VGPVWQVPMPFRRIRILAAEYREINADVRLPELSDEVGIALGQRGPAPRVDEQDPMGDLHPLPLRPEVRNGSKSAVTRPDSWEGISVDRDNPWGPPIHARERDEIIGPLAMDDTRWGAGPPNEASDRTQERKTRDTSGSRGGDKPERQGWHGGANPDDGDIRPPAPQVSGEPQDVGADSAGAGRSGINPGNKSYAESAQVVSPPSSS